MNKSVYFARAFSDVAAAFTVTLVALGDRLGLFRQLGQLGPSTAQELAAAAGVDERYTEEWLAAMVGSGYIAESSARGRYAITPGYWAVLATDSNADSLGGLFQTWSALAAQLNEVAELFVTGRGARFMKAGNVDLRAGVDRMARAYVQWDLLRAWIPSVPGLDATLTAGCAVAEVGCGGGEALFRLAECYPNSRFVGIDEDAYAISRAKVEASQKDEANRICFEVRDATDGLGGDFDVVVGIDVLNNASNPLGVLQAIRRSLAGNCVYLCAEPRSSEKAIGDQRAMLFGFSVLCDLPSALEGCGPGLGSLGCTESMMKQLCNDAGFTQVRLAKLDGGAFYSVYEIRP